MKLTSDSQCMAADVRALVTLTCHSGTPPV